MKSYKPSDIRVVGIFGHRGSGKTSLAEAFLYNAKVTKRLGSVEAGQQTLEIEPEAIERQTTMAANTGYCEWSGVRIHFIDTPGDGNFWGATNRAIQVVDAAVVTVRLLLRSKRYLLPASCFTGTKFLIEHAATPFRPV